MNAFYSSNTNLDYSIAKMGFMLQYEAAAAEGSISGIALGRQLDIPNLALVNGSTNPLNGTLAASPLAAFDLSVKGSDWSLAFQNVAPGPVVPVDAFTNLFTRILRSRTLTPMLWPRRARFDLNIPLFLPNTVSTNGGFTLGWSGASSCVDSVQFTSLSATSHAGIITDEDFGSLQSEIRSRSSGNAFSVCAKPHPSRCQCLAQMRPFLFSLELGKTPGIPTGPISPLVFPVKDPTINGTSLIHGNQRWLGRSNAELGTAQSCLAVRIQGGLLHFGPQATGLSTISRSHVHDQ